MKQINPQMHLFIEWFLGAISLLIATAYLVSVNPSALGATDYSVGVTVGIAFVLYLLAGYLWFPVKPLDFFNGRINGEERPTRS